MAIAIGILDLGVSGHADLAHKDRIRTTARRRHHELAQIVVYGPGAGMQVATVREALHTHGATLIIAADHETVYEMRRAWTELADVLICYPEETWAHRTIWPVPAGVVGPVIA